MLNEYKKGANDRFFNIEGGGTESSYKPSALISSPRAHSYNVPCRLDNFHPGFGDDHRGSPIDHLSEQIQQQLHIPWVRSGKRRVQEEKVPF